ncbi:hypothetical protein G6L37_04860 [Agrobacterium rubi]|nr:hypothetical protein [Agrobacterium rubi]NTF24685.1 hypothetical protein [Agrobacterium rubi]
MYDQMNNVSTNPRIARMPPLEERNAFLDGLAEKEIRKLQDINQYQISLAKTEEVLEYLRVIEDDLMQAMMRRC